MKRRQFHCKIAATLAAVSALPLSARQAGPGPGIRDTVDAAIRPVMAQYDVPGMAVAVTVDGESACFNYGVASREARTPVADDTLFELGSVSKTFTATLACYAQALGKLALDDHPGSYLPRLRASAIDKASLLHLGTYTAGGLPLQFPDDVTDSERMIGYFRQWKPDAAPGAQRRYSNPSIGLLGHLTALALKMDFADAVQALLFAPLGLDHSHVRVPESAMASYAWGYARENKPIRVNPGMFDAQAYGIKSTAADMIRFLQANIAPGGLPEPLRRAIAGTHVGHFQAGPMVQGLGWEQSHFPVTLDRLLAANSGAMLLQSQPATRLAAAPAPSAPTLFNKTGSTNGFGAYVAFVPQQQIGIVLLANRNIPIPARITAAHAILQRLAAPRSSPAPGRAASGGPDRHAGADATAMKR
jgi:beta-lactamase class C